MNRITAIALLIAAALMTPGIVAAQSGGFEVNIPFEFNVNHTLLPAGSYTIGMDILMHQDVLVIRDQTRTVKAADFGQSGLIGPGTPHSLIFHQYGSQYFLSRVRFDVASNGIFLPATKSEDQVRKSGWKEEMVFTGGGQSRGPQNPGGSWSAKTAY